MRKQVVLSLFVFFAICTLNSFLGLEISTTGFSWYDHIQKPAYCLPDHAYPIMGAVLNLLVALSGWLVYQQEKSLIRRFILQLFGLQLVLHLVWTGLFFHSQSPLSALVVSILLLFCVLHYIILTSNVSRWSAFLFLPYAIWIFCVSLLNLAIWLLNP